MYLCETGVNGWIDIQLPSETTTPPTTTTTTTTTVNKQLPLGGFAILECLPRTNDPSTFTVTWLRNKAVINDSAEHRILNGWTLMVTSPSPAVVRGAWQGEGPDGKVVQYECIVDGLQYYRNSIRRTFNLTLTTGKRVEE